MSAMDIMLITYDGSIPKSLGKVRNSFIPQLYSTAQLVHYPGNTLFIDAATQPSDV